MYNSYVDATNAFIDSADWLTERDAPAVHSLLSAAAALDDKLVVALLTTYGVIYRHLVDRAPADAEDIGSEVAQFLKAAGK